MKKTRFKEEQIIKVLKQVEAGGKVAEVCWEHAVMRHTITGRQVWRFGVSFVV
jgi:hypothetical protein